MFTQSFIIKKMKDELKKSAAVMASVLNTYITKAYDINMRHFNTLNHTRKNKKICYMKICFMLLQTELDFTSEHINTGEYITYSSIYTLNNEMIEIVN